MELSVNFSDLFVKELFAPGHTAAWAYLSRFTYPWEALPGIGRLILELGVALDGAEYEKRGDDAWIHKTAVVAPSAHIGSRVIICAGAQVRHCAFIRENALVGDGAVVGNSTELKNVILFDKVQAPHYNYIGDSILGFKSHMGAGAITSNVKSDYTLVAVAYGDTRIETGLKKFGAILGDNVEVGCNSVLNPGAVIGAGTSIYPLSMVRGYIPAGSIYKKQGEIVERVESEEWRV
jgi:NDP-sugar pyrophosphorylase family protein